MAESVGVACDREDIADNGGVTNLIHEERNVFGDQYNPPLKCRIGQSRQYNLPKLLSEFLVLNSQRHLEFVSVRLKCRPSETKEELSDLAGTLSWESPDGVRSSSVARFGVNGPAVGTHDLMTVSFVAPVALKTEEGGSWMLITTIGGDDVDTWRLHVEPPPTSGEADEDAR